MSYISRLIDQNHRIQQLSKSINTYYLNEHHLQSMREEYIRKKNVLKQLYLVWNTKYATANDFRRSLRNELYMAKYQQKAFEQRIIAESQEMNSEALQLCIKHMGDELESLQHPSPFTGSVDGIDRSTQPVVTPVTNLENSRTQNGIVENPDMELKVNRSWSLASAAVVSERLETEYVNIQRKMRRLGSQSCVLTIQLKSIEEEIEVMKAKMSSSPESLYSDINMELLPIKIQIYRELLATRKHHDLLPTTDEKFPKAISKDFSKNPTIQLPNPSPDRSPDPLPSRPLTRYSHHSHRTSSNKHTRMVSDDSVTSWATSVASSVIESTVIGSDFGFKSEDLFSFLETPYE